MSERMQLPPCDAPFWCDSEDDYAGLECDLSVISLIIHGSDGEPGSLVQWQVNWHGDWHTGHSGSIEQAKRDARAFGLELLAQLTALLRRLEP